METIPLHPHVDYGVYPNYVLHSSPETKDGGLGGGTGGGTGGGDIWRRPQDKPHTVYAIILSSYIYNNCLEPYRYAYKLPWLIQA